MNIKHSINALLILFIISVTSSCSASDTTTALARISELQKHVGKTVSIEGTVSNMPWQHMIKYTEAYPVITYLDVNGDQTVLYSKQPIECPHSVQVTGQAIEVAGQSKDPRSNAPYKEYHIMVHSWKCL